MSLPPGVLPVRDYKIQLKRRTIESTAVMGGTGKDAM